MGFFDLAIAAPSMKAALEAWGSNSSLFHQGFAKEAADPRVIAATMKNPGVVLKRPVGSNKAFQEHSNLPTDLPATSPRRKPEKSPKAAKKTASPKIDGATARKAAVAFEKKQREREIQRRKEEAAEARTRERREQKVSRAQAAFEKARKEHDARAGAIEDARAELDHRGKQEDMRWQELKKRLEIAIKKAGA
jgi:flagellar biosynthesis GTPase FlhF